MYRERAEPDATVISESCDNDKMHIEKLERELRNCSQEIEYLQDELKLRSVEANFMGEHVQSLELKLAAAEKLHAKRRLISDLSVQSDSRQLLLLKELDSKEHELQKSALHIENLEGVVVDSQCEIESLKLDVIALEQRCSKAEKYNQQVLEEKVMMSVQIEELEAKLLEKQTMINTLKVERKELEEKMKLSERNITQSLLTVEEHLDNWLRYFSKICASVNGQSDQHMLFKLENGFSLPRDMCACEENIGRFLSKLSFLTSADKQWRDKIEKTVNGVHESELVVKQLKKELREEKIKAKEEAEDLTQEMAELRYQLTDMLEEESKRRAFIEQTSIQRIQDLEAQVHKEQKKSAAVLKLYQEMNSLAERKSVEINKLRIAIKRLHVAANLEATRGSKACDCGYCDKFGAISSEGKASVEDEALDVTSLGRKLGQALLEWHPAESAGDEHR